MRNDSRVETRVSEQELSGQGIAGVAGVDLGDKHSSVCLLGLDGERIERKKIRTNVAAFERYFSAGPPLRVVFEAGTESQTGRAVLKAREALIETRTKLINSLRGTVKSFGYRLPAASGAAFVTKVAAWLPES